MRAVAVLRPTALFVAVVFTSSLVFGGLLWLAPGAPTDQPGGFVGWLTDFWLGAVKGESQRSYRGYPVGLMVRRGAATTLPVIAAAALLSLLVSVGVALLRRGRATRGLGRGLRRVLRASSLTPVFLLGYLAVVLFAVPPEGPRLTAAAILILALGDGMASDVLLGVEAELERLLGRDFVHSARLRGVPLAPLLVRHAAVPLAQLLAGKASYLVGGVLVLEMVLGIQGLGLMGYKAAQHADFPLLVAITVFVTALVAGMQLAVDLLRALLDPRERSGAAQGEVL